MFIWTVKDIVGAVVFGSIALLFLGAWVLDLLTRRKKRK
jgi:hypothetical protein